MHVRQSGTVTERAIVLLHGSGRASRMWQPVMRDLSAGWHVLAPDLPGFGRSTGPFTVSGAAQAVAEWPPCRPRRYTCAACRWAG